MLPRLSLIATNENKKLSLNSEGTNKKIFGKLKMLKRHKILGRKATSAHRKQEHNINRNSGEAKSRVTLFFCYT